MKVDQNAKLTGFEEDLSNKIIYYTMDAKNHIHLVYPNFHDKSNELQVINLISKKQQNGFGNYKEWKRVTMNTLKDRKAHHDHKSFI